MLILRERERERWDRGQSTRTGDGGTDSSTTYKPNVRGIDVSGATTSALAAVASAMSTTTAT